MAKKSSRSSHIRSAFLAILSTFFFVMLLLYPQQSFDSSLRGIHIWWDVVFPALLPFFIISEVLIGFGVIHFMGVILEPIMRPLFRVPGIGAFVWAMGLSSGYPIGAKLTAQLRQEELISQAEGERLVSFSSTSNPIFMFGAIAVGFFHDVSLGIIIALTHYIANIIVGLGMAFYKRNESTKHSKRVHHRFIITRALQAMHRARIKDGRTIGKLLGDAVQSSMTTSFLIGGFIIIFSVVVNLFQTVGFIDLFSSIIAIVLQIVGISPELSPALIAGLFEMTLGAKIASEAPHSIFIMEKIAIVSGLLAFGGFSIHAQVATIIGRTDIRYKPFFFAKMTHGLLAAILTFILWNPLYPWISTSSLPVFSSSMLIQSSSSLWIYVPYLALAFILLLSFLCLLGLLTHTVVMKK